MTKKPTIAVYVPRQLYRFDAGITVFVRGLYRSIRKSKKYRLFKIHPRMCVFTSRDEAQKFVTKHNIVFVVYHDSRVLPTQKAYEQGLTYLAECVPFLNPASVHVADDKLKTKRILRRLGIPVLPEVLVTNRVELWQAMSKDTLYVAKPHDAESGRGVKLLKRTDADLLEYKDTKWQKIQANNSTQGIVLSSPIGVKSLAILCVFILTFILLSVRIFPAMSSLLFGLSGISFVIHIRKKLPYSVVYDPLMLEPFFGDTTQEFYCLRCTVLGDKVIEAAKKSNKYNVTPNISHGGTAHKVILSHRQEAMAVAATKAVGATFAGVDLIVAHDKTVVCEVNVGRIGVYCKQTGVDGGKILADYVMQQCDVLTKKITIHTRGMYSYFLFIFFKQKFVVFYENPTRYTEDSVCHKWRSKYIDRIVNVGEKYTNPKDA